MRIVLGCILVLGAAAFAGRSTDSLYYKVFESPYLWRTDKGGNGLVSGHSFSWLDPQTGPCMDPAGEYIYEVHESTLRRHDATSGSFVDYSLTHPARSVGCGTDGEHFYYGWTARVFCKVTLAGTEVSATNLGQYYACYHGIGVARDTLWVVDNDFAPLNYRGFPCIELNGDTAQWCDTIHNPLVSVGIGMPICWDGERFFAACGGYSSSPVLWWDAEHNFLDSTMLPVDIRTVMTPMLGTAVGEPTAPDAARPTPHAGPTIVRGVLFWSATTPSLRNVGDIALHSADGRRVMNLAPGPNDVSRLSPGVYFVRTADGGGRQASRVVIAD